MDKKKTSCLEARWK